MSGIIGTFQMRSQFVTLPEYPAGYCHIESINGGSLYKTDESNPLGQWEARLRYYAGIADFNGNPNSYMNVENLFYLSEDPSQLTPIIQHLNVPYIPTVNPVETVKDVLRSWWSAGTIVD